MAKLRVAPSIVENMVFGFSANPVRIIDVKFDHDWQHLIFEIEGDDVPDAPEITAIVSVRENRAGQRFGTMTFEPVNIRSEGQKP